MNSKLSKLCFSEQISENPIKIEKYDNLNYIFNKNDLKTGQSLELYGEYAAEEIAVLEKLVNEDDIVLDIGSHIGIYALALAKKLSNKGAILAFEPNRLIFQQLCANISINNISNIYTHQAALSNHQESLYSSELDFNTSSNKTDLALNSNCVGESTTVVVIDRLNLPRCNLMKVTTNGMEINVLTGAANTIKKYRPILYVENSVKSYSKDLIMLLESFDYDLYWSVSPLYRTNNLLNNKENVFQTEKLVNIIGLPKGDNSKLEGFSKVKDAFDYYEE
tara:strand:+ start:9982 stop:10815 length:834 start_codon:yes stop_codon:yes gene_type:complete